VGSLEKLPADVAILAPGHSARDTFRMLSQKGIHMEAKPFAVGFRIEHPQAMIDYSQYGREDARKILGPAAYKLTYTAKDNRGVYSFCMCPGGYVVNASSEEGHLCVNGMSYHNRDSANANSALLAAISPKEYTTYVCDKCQAGRFLFGDERTQSMGLCEMKSIPEPLMGMYFQRMLEKSAFEAAGGRVVQQLFADFEAKVPSTEPGGFGSCLKGLGSFGDARRLLPTFLSDDIAEGIRAFGRKIKGFDRPDAILSGIESRSSSPVRILRDEGFESSIPGLYPAGEGAGYAGGIMSAAMDGLRVAEAVIRKYQPTSER
ncbi:MAG: NAD(P)/FAD-dependent oxidoreductase, partial [bacterium]